MDTNNQKHPLNPKKIALFIVYALIAILLFFAILSANDLPEIMEQLKNIDITYILLAVLMILIYLALYPLSLCILTKAKKCEIKSSVTYTIAMTEHFFNGITPLATGGQPFQAHSFTKAKVKISDSTGLLLTNLLIYMAVTTGFSLTGLFFFRTLTSNINPGWLPIIIIGYSLNFMVLVVTFTLGMSAKVRGALVRFIYFLCKFRIFKKLEPKAQDIKKYFEQVQEAFHELIKKKKHFFSAFATKILSFAFLYSSPFFILLGLGVPLTASQIFLVMSGTSFAVTAVGFIPTPGASGGVEGSAGQVFKSIIISVAPTMAITAPSMANGVMLIWRLLTYYMVMGLSLVSYICLEIYFKYRKRKEVPDTEDNTEPQETQILSLDGKAEQPNAQTLSDGGTV